MSERYARQIVLPEVGPEGQARLGAATVAVIGAGGLGCAVLPVLAGGGVGRLIVIDDDRVELSNLHRQPLYTMADIGRPKVEAARDAIARYNPDVEIAARAGRLGPEDAAALVAEADLVVDATDRLAVTYVTSDACLQAGKPLIAASVIGQKGFVGGFCGGAPSYRAIFPDMPSSVGSCAANGVLGSAVAIVGGFQAHMALQVILDTTPSPLGRLVTLDLSDLAIGGFRFDGAPEPAGPGPAFIGRGGLTAGDLVVELRDEAEAPEPVVEDALRVSPAAIEADAGLPRDRRLVFACATGVRAFRAARSMQRRGRADVAVLLAE
ncbi:HesA/MoeB/ThiF family protein [Lutibaculum baratangense]|nr:HesA/MoeB/ThiF family protein [Lutibaculum baratangense]